MLAHFPSTNGYLTRLDLGYVSGVPILEALPSQAWDITKHFMKSSNDPLAQVIGAPLSDMVRRLCIDPH